MIPARTPSATAAPPPPFRLLEPERPLPEPVRRAYARGEAIAHAGDPFPVVAEVVSGAVWLRRFTERGDVVTLRLLGPGDLLGGFGAGAATLPFDALCLSRRAELRCLDRSAFLASLASRPRDLGHLLEQLAQQLTDSERRLELTGEPALTGVARTLHGLAKRFGRPAADDWTDLEELALTHEILGALTGHTRVTATGAMGRLRELDLVRGAWRRYAVDRAGLERYLGGVGETASRLAR